MIAVLNMRTEPHYRREAFIAGLQAVGYKLELRARPSSREDVLVQWNRKVNDEPAAANWEASGGTVLVCENGYIGKDDEGRQLYSISVGQHNGAGWFPIGTEDRFAPLGVTLKPWREDGKHVLICGQRGIGSRLMASPPGWDRSAVRKLAMHTTRQLRIRPHPGNFAPATTLEHDLAGAWACAVWSSSSGVKALTMGYPVLFDAPHWIAAASATRLDAVEQPLCDDSARNTAMQTMAHGQWRVSEIEAGEPFARILSQLKAKQ